MGDHEFLELMMRAALSSYLEGTPVVIIYAYVSLGNLSGLDNLRYMTRRPSTLGFPRTRGLLRSIIIAFHIQFLCLESSWCMLRRSPVVEKFPFSRE